MWWVALGLFSNSIFGTVHSTGQNGQLSLQNPCSQGELFYPYPDDPAQYVQCSEWGRAFLMDCPPNHIWHNEHKTCVDVASGQQNDGKIVGNGMRNGDGNGTPRRMAPRPRQNMNQVGASQGNRLMRRNNGVTSMHGSEHRNANQNPSQKPPSHDMKQNTDLSSPSATSDSSKAKWDMNMYMKLMQSMGYRGGMPAKSWHITKTWRPPPPQPTLAAKEEDDNVDPLNPCLNQDLKYIPHPSDPTKYFECNSGEATEKTCPENHIWRQEAEGCHRIPQPKPKPTQAQTPRNPCMGGHQKFWPYKDDPRKYVECQGWYDLPILRSCESGKIWIQREMRCVYLMVPRPPQPRPTVPRPHPTHTPTRPPPPTTTTPLPPTSTESTMDFCLNSDSFYHPYPPDSTKFIQCDEYGNMYIRYCGPKKRWDDTIKTCIGNNNVTITTEAPNQDDDASAAAGTGGASSTSVSSSSSSRSSSSSTTRSSSRDILDNILANNPCNNNEVFDPSTGRCMDMSELTQLVDDGFRIICPDGYKLNKATYVCEEYDSMGKRDTRIFLDYNLGPVCESGFLWDTTLRACVEAVHVADMIAAFGSLKDADSYFKARYPNIKAENFDQSNFAVSDNIEEESSPQEVPIPEYAGENPCGSKNDIFYYTFPDDPRYFIQCDLAGFMYVQPCTVGLYWNQGLLTCTAYNAQLDEEQGDTEEGGDTGTDTDAGSDGGVDIVDADSLAKNPCIDSVEIYHPYPYDPHLFVMCTGNMPFIMSCSEKLVWNEITQTCDWPDLEPPETTDAPPADATEAA